MIRQRSLLGGLRLLGGCLLFAAAALCAGPAGIAHAAEPSVVPGGEADVLVGQATLAYEEKRYQDALAALREALQLDPENVDALYYTGLVHSALGQLDQAAAAFEKARTLHPTDLSILFQLGVIYFGQGNYEKAQPLLEQVFAADPRLDGLGYYVGFMRYRSKDYQGAINAFRSGASTDPNIQQLTGFYTGLAFGILGLPERAAGEIRDALRLQPASPLTGPAERLRDTVVAAREKERPYRLEVRVGGFYDDNVAVIPRTSNDLENGPVQDPTLNLVEILRNQRHASPGWLGSLRGDYTFLRGGSFFGLTPLEALKGLEATATYGVFTTQNSDLNRFSIVDHQGGLGTTYRGALETPLGVFPYQAGMQYTYDFLTLGGDEFVTRHTVAPVFTLIENQQNLTVIQGRYQHKRFASSPNPIQAEKRDGSNYMAGFLHLLRFEGDKHLLKVGYQADWDITQGGNLAYFANRVLAGGQYTFPFAKPFANLRFSYDFDVHLRDYRQRNTILPLAAPGPGTKARSDAEYTNSVRLTFPLTENVPFLTDAKIPGILSLSADYQNSLARSNLDVFSFKRNVGSLSIVWSY